MPEALYLRGNFSVLSEPCIAIVGTRKATHDGILTVKQLARELTHRGFAIVSGLALGIDAAAHEGALADGGKTIAVLGNGVDTIYPAQHASLGYRILESDGCILSEHPDGTPSLPHHFLARNRIISALALATIVIEAPARSGAIATARFAAEQGREVFVFPGNHTHTNYAGSHTLIRSGARLVANIEHIIEDLGDRVPVPHTNAGALRPDEHPVDAAILTVLAMARVPLDVDSIASTTTLEPHTVQQRLALLILDGRITEKSNGFTIV